MDSSTALMANQLTVKFLDVLDRYPCNEDIECKYICKNYTIQDGDRIAIFQMGWNSLKNYIIFEWAIDACPSINSVIFSRYDLPSRTVDKDDLYQFCYISGDNVVHGVSTPFQIYSADSKPITNLTDSFKNETQCSHLKQILALKDQEILKLKEENAILKESLKALVDQKKFQRSQSCVKDINELKEVTRKLNDILLSQQKEIESLQLEMRKDKAANKNLKLERILAEKRCEAISKQREALGNRRVCNFNLDLGTLESLPPFPFDGNDMA